MKHFLVEKQQCDYATNWSLLADSVPNFVISEISVNQDEMFPCMEVGFLAASEQIFMLRLPEVFVRFSQFYIGRDSTMSKSVQ